MQTNSDSQMSLDDSNNTSGNRQIEIDILGECPNVRRNL